MKTTQLMSMIAGLAMMAGSAAAVDARAQGRTIYEPSARDPRIVAALAARTRMETSGGDIKVMEELFAPDLVVNSPINMVVSRDNVLGRMRNGQIGYEEAQAVIEFAGVRGDAVVIMGEEIVKPIGAAPNAGKTVRRRFTDVWREVEGRWRLTVRQATVTTVQ